MGEGGDRESEGADDEGGVESSCLRKRRLSELDGNVGCWLGEGGGGGDEPLLVAGWKNWG